MQQQVVVLVLYKQIVMDTELRLDLLINDCVVVELKAIEHNSGTGSSAFNVHVVIKETTGVVN